MKKKILNVRALCLFWLLSIVSVKAHSQCQPTQQLNVSTGKTASGVNLSAPGAIDPFWTLVNVAPPSASGSGGVLIPNAYTILTGPAATWGAAWCQLPGTIGLSVISNFNFPTNNLNPAQPWRFIRKFSVSAPGTVVFSGQFIGDDAATLSIYSNSGTQYFTEAGINHSVPKSFSDSMQLPAGCYYLEMKLENIGGGAMGFAVNATMSGNSATGAPILSNPSGQCCSGSIVSGQKWIDNNCNGKLDQVDLPANGWTFNLLSGATIVQTTTTNALGEFYFYNVPNGNYTVAEVNQPGYTASFPTTGTQSISITSTDTVINTLFLNCKDTVPASCATIIDPKVVCDNSQYYLEFSVKNNTSWDFRGITIKNIDPNITAVSSLYNGTEPFFDISDIYPTLIGSIRVPLYVPVWNSSACFELTFCDKNLPGGSFNCCTPDSFCVNMPRCKDTPNVICKNPCDGLTEVTWKPADSTGNCCFTLSFVNNYLAANIGTITFNGIDGTEFSLTSTSGWAYGGVSSATYRELIAPVGGVGIGTYNDFISMCITSTNPAPHKVVVHYYDVNKQCMCADTLEFSQCKVVPPNCATIVNDSLYCDKGKTILKFNVLNNSGFPIRQLDNYISDTAHFVITPPNIQFDSANAIPVGATAGPFTVEIDTANGGATQFCFQLSAHNKPYTATSYATICCSDAIRQVCLPFLNCKNNNCCEFDQIIIPNGITPNGDGKNDTWVLTKPVKCDSIKIEIFNRWGNKVYQDDNYLNNWGGTNQSGDKLPQSTYFVVITLQNGSSKGLYVDLRY